MVRSDVLTNSAVEMQHVSERKSYQMRTVDVASVAERKQTYVVQSMQQRW